MGARLGDRPSSGLGPERAWLRLEAALAAYQELLALCGSALPASPDPIPKPGSSSNAPQAIDA